MKKRNLALIASTAIMAASLALIPAALDKTDASATETTGVFQMVYGASVRTATENPGIRFTAEMSQDVYSAVTADPNKSFGMIVVPSDYLTGCTDGKYVEYLTENYVTTDAETGEVTKDSSGVINELGGAYYYDVDKDGTEELCISGAVYGLQYSNLNRDFTGIAFIKTQNGDEVSYEYAKDPDGTTTAYHSRNVVYVASKAYEDPDDKEKHGTVLQNFIKKGVNQQLGLEESAEPVISVELDKTEAKYLEDTPVSVVYKVGDEVKDIQLPSTVSYVSGEASLKDGAVRVHNLNVSPASFAENFANPVTLSISVPALDLTAEDALSIVCDYTQIYTLDPFAVNVEENFDINAYLAEKVTLQTGHTPVKYIYYNQGKVHNIVNENGVWTTGDNGFTATKDEETLSVVDDVKGQNIREVQTYVQGSNGNTLNLITASISFFEESTVVKCGLIDFSQGVKVATAVGDMANADASRTTQSFTLDKDLNIGQDAGFYYTPCSFSGQRSISFLSNYSVEVMNALLAKGYTTMTMYIKHYTDTGIDKNCGSNTINTDGTITWACNIQKGGGNTVKIDVETFIANLNKPALCFVTDEAQSYMGHVQIANNSNLAKATTRYVGFTVPTLVKAA